jgi:glycosyltransferase involved in cell wall biosynthesis
LTIDSSIGTSIIVPLWNSERYLEETIASLHAQHLESCRAEIVFVDDGSTDRSAEIVSSLAPQARYIRQSHGGISAALNLGVARSRGDMIAFLDADDLWPPGSLKSRQAILEGDGSVDMVAGLTEQFISPELDESFARKLFCPDKALPGYLLGSILARKHVFDRAGPFDPGIPAAQSFDWFVRAMDSGLSLRLIQQVVLRRRLHENNHSHEGIQLAHYTRILKSSLDRRRQRNGGVAQELPIPKSSNPPGQA